MLASTLDYLVSEGMVCRHPYDTIPPKVEYSLLPIAKSFLREISYVIEWGQLHFHELYGTSLYFISSKNACFKKNNKKHLLCFFLINFVHKFFIE